MHSRNQIKLVVWLWIFSIVRLLLTFPIWANFSDWRRNEHFGVCDHPLYYNLPISLMQRSIALYIPVSLMIFFYGAIIIKVCKVSKMDPTIDLLNENKTLKKDKGNPNAERNGQNQRKSNLGINIHLGSDPKITKISESITLQFGPIKSPQEIFVEKNYCKHTCKTYRNYQFSPKTRSPEKELLSPVINLNQNNAVSQINEKNKQQKQKFSIVGSLRRHCKCTTTAQLQPNWKDKSTEKLKNSFRIVSLVILAFLLANVPWHVMENLRITKAVGVSTTGFTYVFTWILTYMNAMFNPIFYFFMNNSYRMATLRILKCKSSRQEKRKEYIQKLQFSSSACKNSQIEKHSSIIYRRAYNSSCNSTQISKMDSPVSEIKTST